MTRVTRSIRAAVREQVLPVWGLALGFLVLGLPFADATGMGAPRLAVLDFALWWIWLVGCGLAMWLGSRCIAVPLEARSAVWELSGPTSAGTWGLTRMTGAAVVAALSHGLLAAIALFWIPLAPGYPAFAAVTTAEVVMLVALSAFLGSVFRPLPALALCGALWLAGHLAGMWAEVMHEQGWGALVTLLAFVPDLDLLDVHGTVVRGGIPTLRHIGVALVWSTAWTCAAAAGTVTLLNRRDLV